MSDKDAVLAKLVSAQWRMGIGQHRLNKYRDFLREFSHRSAAERKAGDAEKRRLRLPTRIAVLFTVVGLGMLLAWAIFSAVFGQ